MEDIKRFIAGDRFAAYLGIEMTSHGPGKAEAKMPIKPHHLNSAGTLHGGAIFGLADAVFSAASNSHGTLALAINVSISYFKAINAGILMAAAEEVSINPRLATYLVTVTNEKDERIALFQGTVYRKKERLAEVLGG